MIEGESVRTIFLPSIAGLLGARLCSNALKIGTCSRVSVITDRECGQRMFLRENLTLERMQLLERVEKELHSYQYKWVKDWNIFVRKDTNSRAIKVHSEKVPKETAR